MIATEGISPLPAADLAAVVVADEPDAGAVGAELAAGGVEGALGGGSVELGLGFGLGRGLRLGVGDGAGGGASTDFAAVVVADEADAGTVGTEAPSRRVKRLLRGRHGWRKKAYSGPAAMSTSSAPAGR